ncbi:MAG: hypothetical protein KDC43_10720 [Saprospiraceae bacterium]|nr:hypothetical protein [Saprospiraceae bacterium]MCB0680664.1 hypothetical protein [Saprospiraceae bacterium]
MRKIAVLPGSARVRGFELEQAKFGIGLGRPAYLGVPGGAPKIFEEKYSGFYTLIDNFVAVPNYQRIR